MFDLTFIFVTLSLGILVLVAYQMRIPQAAIPLGIIYIIFVVFGNSNPDSNEEVYESGSQNLINELEQLPDGQVKLKSIRLKQKPITPKPLNFDSGRSAKDDQRIEDRQGPAQVTTTIKEEKKKELSNPVENQLLLRNIEICKSVKKRNPIGSDFYFNNLVDSLFCYTRIQNFGQKQEVSHVWFFENKLVSKISYNVKRSNIYRSWTRKTILPHQIGSWRVDVLDQHNQLLGSKEFQVME